MAGLTKEQRAQRAAEEAQRADSGLVLMAKDGEEVEVHPTCVQAHHEAGWSVVSKDE